jgi:hypothetical protein
VNQKHTDELKKSAPNFFADPARCTAITAYGFECRDGWFDLLKNAFADIEAVLATLPEEHRRQIHCVQVKEKFWGLRIYIHGPAPRAIHEIIAQAVRNAAKTCECCGTPKKVEP